MFAPRVEWEGTVTHVEGPFLATRSPRPRPVRILLWSVGILAVGALGIVLLARRMAPSALRYSRRASQGSFLAGVATHAAGTMVASRLTGNERGTLVRNLRLRLPTGAAAAARLEGDVVAGMPAPGDRVSMRGRILGGTLLVEQLRNLTTSSDLVVRRM